MGERRVDLERLARLLHLLLLAEVLDRPHVVEAVRELDEDDADVLRHREHHLPVVLRLRLLAALELDPRQLRDALDELADLVAELGAHLLDRRVGVLDDVVEQRGGERRVVGVQLGEDPRDAERVDDEVLAAAALLALVRLASRSRTRARAGPRSTSGLYSATSSSELLEELLVPLGRLP